MRDHDRICNPEFFFSLTRLSTTHAWRGDPCMEWIRESMRTSYKGKTTSVRRIAALYGVPHLTNRPARTPGELDYQRSLKTPLKLRCPLIRSINSPGHIHAHCRNPRCVNPVHLYVGPKRSTKTHRPRHIRAVPANPNTLIIVIPPPPTPPIITENPYR